MKLLIALLLCVSGVRALAADAPPYVKMGKDLSALKADFNSRADQLRLLYIVGPT